MAGNEKERIMSQSIYAVTCGEGSLDHLKGGDSIGYAVVHGRANASDAMPNAEFLRRELVTVGKAHDRMSKRWGKSGQLR